MIESSLVDDPELTRLLESFLLNFGEIGLACALRHGDIYEVRHHNFLGNLFDHYPVHGDLFDDLDRLLHSFGAVPIFDLHNLYPRSFPQSEKETSKSPRCLARLLFGQAENSCRHGQNHARRCR